MARALALLVLLVLAAPARAADEPGDLRRLFTHQADVRVAPPGGLVRLELPPAVLAECRPDLSDLRLLDPSGRETPFLVDTGVTAGTRSFVLETVEASS
jgi:hypothetical protein